MNPPTPDNQSRDRIELVTARFSVKILKIAFSLAQAFTPGSLRQEMDSKAPSGAYPEKPLKGLRSDLVVSASQA
jgi:hypothetical protein